MDQINNKETKGAVIRQKEMNDLIKALTTPDIEISEEQIAENERKFEEAENQLAEIIEKNKDAGISFFSKKEMDDLMEALSVEDKEDELDGKLVETIEKNCEENRIIDFDFLKEKSNDKLEKGFQKKKRK